MKNCNSKSKTKCLPPNCNWIDNKCRYVLKPTQKSPCFKKTKKDCINLEFCEWKDKKCQLKSQEIPNWSKLINTKYSIEEQFQESLDNRLKKTLSNKAMDWFEKKYYGLQHGVCVYTSQDRTHDKFAWIDISEMEDFESMKNDKNFKSILKLSSEYGSKQFLYVPENFLNKLLECIKSKYINIIVLPFSMRIAIEKKNNKYEMSNHRNMIIINKFLKTIEFYDPNGGKYHKSMYKNRDFPHLKKFFGSFPELSKFRLVPYETIWNYGFQWYEAMVSQEYGEFGKCIFWSLFLAELRIRYYYIEPKILFDNFISKVDEDDRSEIFSDFIKEYMNYIHKKTRPEHSVNLYSLLDNSAKDILHKQLSKDPDYIPLWNKTRRVDFNYIADQSLIWLQEKYKNTDVCIPFIPATGVDGEISENSISWIELRTFPSEKFEKYIQTLQKRYHRVYQLLGGNKHFGLYISPKIRKMIIDCLSQNKKLILVPISLIRGKMDAKTPFDFSGHKCVIVINNFLKTVEFFYPNGAEAHKNMFGNEDIPHLRKFIRSFPILREYKVYEYSDIHPDAGFQQYESWYPKEGIFADSRAKCSFWMTFISDIRCKYFYLTPDKLIYQILVKLEEGKRPEIFHKFITDYITYLDIKIPKH